MGPPSEDTCIPDSPSFKNPLIYRNFLMPHGNIESEIWLMVSLRFFDTESGGCSIQKTGEHQSVGSHKVLWLRLFFGKPERGSWMWTFSLYCAFGALKGLLPWCSSKLEEISSRFFTLWCSHEDPSHFSQTQLNRGFVVWVVFSDSWLGDP